MARNGSFDKTLEPLAWFDETTLAEGWFDKELIKEAGAYTLTAQTGSYTLTGISATLTRSRLITAQTGSYTLTGVAATLLRSKYITAQVGAYTISGVSANITYTGGAVNYNLIAQTGSYTLTGQNATLTKSKYILASTGSYVFTGVNVTLNRSLFITAQTGAYALAGVDAVITKTTSGAYTLTCQAGAYVISGQSATLTASGQQGGGKSSKTRRFYVDDVPYDVPVSEIDYFLSNLPDVGQKEYQEAHKKQKIVEIKAVDKSGIEITASGKTETNHFEAFKALIFTQIELPSFDFAQLAQFEREKQQQLLLLEALEDRAQQEYLKKYKARLLTLLLD